MSQPTTWLPPVTPWNAGDWSLELRDDEIADLTYRGRLVLRSIRMVVRDQHWETPELQVVDLATSPSSATLTVRSEGFGSSVEGVITVSVDADDALTVDWRGTSRDEFWTNRTGLVILHPPTVAGTELTVLHANGSRDGLAFPDIVAPHQPVFDIRELEWQAHGQRIHVQFDGEIFEMEDQRNWTDASFKTYCRPLSLPMPYRLEPGAELAQSITVRVTGAAASEPSNSPNQHSDSGQPTGAAHCLRLTEAGTFPELTASVGPFDTPSAAEISDAPWLAASPTLLIEPNVALPGWVDLVRVAVASGKVLDVRLVLPEELDAEASERLSPANAAALDACLAELQEATVSRMAVFTAGSALTRPVPTTALREAMARYGVDARVLGGSRSHFTDLNRDHELLPGRSGSEHDLPTEGIVFSMTPMVHAVHTHQVIESVQIQGVVTRDALAIAGDQPVHVGPVTLRPRLASSAEAVAEPPLADARQSAPELAAWVVASAASIARPGVASVCYFEALGPRGLGSFGGDAPGPTPAAAAFAALAELSGGALWHAGADASGGGAGPVWAVGARVAGEAGADTAVVLLSNLSAEPAEVNLELPVGAITGPITLAPFAWLRVAVPLA